MGKDLKGKELGVGISQLKDGRYTARFTSKSGKRIQKYFKKLQECRNWLADAQYNDEHGNISSGSNMTVDSWFEYWISNIKGKNVRPNTSRNYTERYTNNIQEHIGKMLLCDVKPLHCQNILNQMADKYCNSTIKQARITMYSMFQSAVDNEFILKNPVIKNVECSVGKKSKEARVLTKEEQKIFLETAKKSSNFNQYAFLLQTGLRTGEMIGLCWDDVDFEKRVIHIRRTMEYRYSVGEWRVGPPKSKSGYRDVPLTEEACKILLRQKEKNRMNKTVKMEFANYVFLSRKGEPTKNSAYDTTLAKLAKKAGIPHFSMHTLRHTFATRCIEAEMKPKTLQKILGHSNIGITMNLYVHVTEEEKMKEIKSIEKALKVV